MLAKNKSGWCLLEYLPIKEEEIEEYDNVTGAFAIICVQGKYLIGYNRYRKQWEFPAGGIESGETARQAAERELWEETHQRCSKLEFRGLFKIQRPDDVLRKDLVEELADVLMYYNDVLLCYGISAEELKQTYTAKFEKNMKRW